MKRLVIELGFLTSREKAVGKPSELGHGKKLPFQIPSPAFKIHPNIRTLSTIYIFLFL